MKIVCLVILLFTVTGLAAQTCTTDSVYKFKQVTTYDTTYDIHPVCTGFGPFKKCHNDTSIHSIKPRTTWKYVWVYTTTCDSIPSNGPFISGVLQQGAATDYNQMNATVTNAGLDCARAAVTYDDQTFNPYIDKMLTAGHQMQINFNYKSTGFSVGFPTDTNMIRNKAISFFSYYAPKKSQIPVVVVENEWDNLTTYNGSEILGSGAYHNNSIDFYIQELKIVTRVGHQYGFKIADAGITSTAVIRWMWTQLTGQAKTNWHNSYFIGEGLANFNPIMALIAHYQSAVSTIDFDYTNVHWYDVDDFTTTGFKTAASAFAASCNKTIYITNEFGVFDKVVGGKTPTEIWTGTVNQIKPFAKIAVAYSGTGNEPIKLSNANLMYLSKP